MKGTLATFSLPELFRLIDSGAKTGKLTIYGAIEGNDCELWFESGYLLTIVIPAKQPSLLEFLEAKGWLSKAVINQVNRFYRNNQPLGAYLERMGLWTLEQQQEIFEIQQKQIESLFESIDNAFEFHEMPALINVEESSSVSWAEMTGIRIRAAQITFKALARLKRWEHFARQLPDISFCLQRLVKQPKVELSPIELEVWSYADGKTSIKNIAHKLDRPLLDVQKTAFAMSMANLIEETMSAQFSSKASTKTTQRELATTKLTSVTTATKGVVVAKSSQSKAKTEVSTSLLHNLVSFLKGKF